MCALDEFFVIFHIYLNPWGIQFRQASFFGGIQFSSENFIFIHCKTFWKKGEDPAFPWIYFIYIDRLWIYIPFYSYFIHYCDKWRKNQFLSYYHNAYDIIINHYQYSPLLAHTGHVSSWFLFKGEVKGKRSDKRGGFLVFWMLIWQEELSTHIWLELLTIRKKNNWLISGQIIKVQFWNISAWIFWGPVVHRQNGLPNMRPLKRLEKNEPQEGQQALSMMCDLQLCPCRKS